MGRSATNVVLVNVWEVVLATVLASGLAGCASMSGKGLERMAIREDLDGDGKSEKVVFDQGGEMTVAAWKGGVCIWEGVPKRWQPWKLDVADVDGDGRSDIVVGVYKSTRYFPDPHNCLFVYGWDGKRVVPKWLGSSLGKPFTDFAVAEMDGDAGKELVVVEEMQAGGCTVGVYSWNGFGFSVDRREEGPWQEVRLGEVQADGVTVEADGQNVVIGRVNP